MRKLCGKVHLWLSVPFGLIITIICLSGAVLVFETEVMELMRPRLCFVEADGQKALSVGELAGIVTRSLPDSVEVTGVTIGADPRRAYQFSLSQPRRSSLAVNQYTGEVLGRNERASFFSFAFRAHRWLLDSMNPDGGIFWGKVIVGVSTLMFVFVLITGAVVWIPRTRASLANRFRIAVCKGWRRFWYDLHVAAGIYAAVVLLVLALTGLTWSFAWYKNGFYRFFGAEVAAAPQGGRRGQHGSHGRASGHDGGHKQGADRFAHWAEVYEQVALRNPGFEKISLTQGTATVAMSGWGNRRAADSYDFNPRNGEITALHRYEDAERASKLRGWIYSLHVGNWGGLFSKIITFLAALIGASLPLTGYYLWIARVRRSR